MSEERGFRRGPRKPRFCAFCREDIAIDYKAVDTLRRFVSDNGRIRPRRQTGLCAKHQRRIALAIKRARHLALLGFVGPESY